MTPGPNFYRRGPGVLGPRPIPRINTYLLSFHKNVQHMYKLHYTNSNHSVIIFNYVLFYFSRLHNLLQFTALFLISPLILLFAIGAINNVIATSSTSSPSDVTMTSHIKASWEGAQHVLLLSAIDAHMYGSWTFGLVTLAFWPIWMIFWALMWTEPL